MIAAIATLTEEELERSEPVNLYRGPVKALGSRYGIAKAPYIPDTLKWLTIGTVYDHPKSWTFMGGGVAPGQGAVILYTLEKDGRIYAPDEQAADRKLRISWYYRDGYIPCPVSIWREKGIRVTIQHFAIRDPEDTQSLIYSKVQLDNENPSRETVTLHINAGAGIHVPLRALPDHETDDTMAYTVTLEPGRWAIYEFVSSAAKDPVSLDDREGYGTFEENYERLTAQYRKITESLAHPTQLPDQGIADMYKSIQIAIRNAVVKEGDTVQMRSGSNNPARIQTYDREFPHDVPNFIDEFMREGDYELAKQVLNSETYRRMNTSDINEWDGLNYMDTIGKLMLPYAQYLQNTGDLSWFDDDMRAFLKKAARNIHAFRQTEGPHPGLMKKGEDFENWSDDGDYLLADNWGALHGLQSYLYIMERLGDKEEAEWADHEIESLNETLNNALKDMMERNGLDYYWGALDDESYQRYVAGSFYSWVPYSAALSAFPWGALLKGYKYGGIWKEYFDPSIAYALSQRDIRQIPEGSWGAWWGKNTYGSVYNASAGGQCLASDKYRTEPVRNVEFLYRNQCAPFMWSEAFESKGRDAWAGMYLPQESYGNYELWGMSFIKQSILQACVSVFTDGKVIIGRGIPDEWLTDGAVIAWDHVNINDGRIMDFRLERKRDKFIFERKGDDPFNDIIIDLPYFTEHRPTTEEGEVTENNAVVLKPDIRYAEIR